MAKEAKDLEKGDSITVDGVRFVVKDKVLLLGGQVGLIFEDMPATDENVAAFRKLQEKTAGTGILAPVGPGCQGWQYSRAREITRSLEDRKMSELEWRPWMQVATEWGGELCPHMVAGGVYLYQMFSTTFVRFPDKEAAEAFENWAGEHLPYWGYDPVVTLDTNDPEVCEMWAEHIKPEQNYQDSAAHKKINLEFGQLENGVIIPASFEQMDGVDHREMHEAGKWWIRTPDPRYKEPKESEVIIVVERGMVTDVYASDKKISVAVLDTDTDDADRYEEIEEERKSLQARIDAGELHNVW